MWLEKQILNPYYIIMNQQEALQVLIQTAQAAIANGLVKDLNSAARIIDAVRAFRPTPAPAVTDTVAKKVQDKPKVRGHRRVPE